MLSPRALGDRTTTALARTSADARRGGATAAARTTSFLNRRLFVRSLARCAAVRLMLALLALFGALAAPGMAVAHGSAHLHEAAEAAEAYGVGGDAHAGHAPAGRGAAWDGTARSTVQGASQHLRDVGPSPSAHAAPTARGAHPDQHGAGLHGMTVGVADTSGAHPALHGVPVAPQTDLAPLSVPPPEGPAVGALLVVSREVCASGGVAVRASAPQRAVAQPRAPPLG